MIDLRAKLEEYTSSDAYPFHMPGHKRNMEDTEWLNSYDITEIPGFDDLHHPEGVLNDLMSEAARLYGTKDTFYLVNGSTCGILASISAACMREKRVLLARNSHKSAYHAVEIMGLEAVYVYPEWTSIAVQGSISPAEVKKALEENPDIKAVYITSPTYDGVVSDIKSIAEISHEKGTVLIVDEAHGAHFPFADTGFPKSAIALGADLVIQSVHKTLPSPTQTALLHICSDRVLKKDIMHYLNVFESSSPSYLLMAGINDALRFMEKSGAERLRELSVRIDEFADKARRELKLIRVITNTDEETGIFDKDRSKIIINTSAAGISGEELSERLRKEYQIQLEMASEEYAVALCSVMDTEVGFERLYEALKEIDASLKGKALQIKTASEDFVSSVYKKAKQTLSIKTAFLSEKETVAVAESAGRVSGEYVYMYPPGIPILCPGEVVSEELIKGINLCRENGFKLYGQEDLELNSISVVR